MSRFSGHDPANTVAYAFITHYIEPYYAPISGMRHDGCESYGTKAGVETPGFSYHGKILLGLLPRLKWRLR
jgi:hypothetical protein